MTTPPRQSFVVRPSLSCEDQGHDVQHTATRIPWNGVGRIQVEHQCVSYGCPRMLVPYLEDANDPAAVLVKALQGRPGVTITPRPDGIPARHNPAGSPACRTGECHPLHLPNCRAWGCMKAHADTPEAEALRLKRLPIANPAHVCGACGPGRVADPAPSPEPPGDPT